MKTELSMDLDMFKQRLMPLLLTHCCCQMPCFGMILVPNLAWWLGSEVQMFGSMLDQDCCYRARSVADRKRWVTLVEGVKDNAGTVFIFSSLHVSGQQLDKFSGVAAILRFPMPDLDDDDDDDSSDED
eukprot:m.60922 g.60922  ORF g.60922 m.60922 type:complete len:128 (+) comp13867_c0_seq4:942-1325(+)